MKLPIVLVALLPLVAMCAPPEASPPEESPSGYTAEIEQWRAKRDAALRKPDGWLTLVGLFWLEEGDNAFGAAEGNFLRFPDGTIDDYAGVLIREGREVRLLPGAGVALMIDGSPVGGMTTLSLDTSEGGPTVVESGSLSFYAIERGEMIGLRVKDSESSVLAAFKGMEYFPAETAWRKRARYELFDQPRILKTPNVLGTVSEEKISGQVVFEVDGETHSLLPSGNPEDGFFLVFGDRTNGAETYGGGRFLYSEPVQEDGSVIVDFNKAYSPPCVFTPYATCPLPAAENKLAFRIEAGEMTFGAGH